MKKCRVETISSLDNKLDVRDVIVDGDKIVRGKNWVTLTVQIAQVMRTIILPREQIKRIEELPV